MIDKKAVERQLKKIGVNGKGWGRTEIHELHNILLPDEELFEVVNGFYEGGFALLVATDVRVLLVDKKPMNYLTVEDLRFDMINEMDYNHRLIGAHINIATGNKNLKFTSLNQPRLRKLIGHVQHCMAEAKKQQTTHAQDQKTHLEQINQQLQAYLVAQHQHNLALQDFQKQQAAGLRPPPPPEPVKPSPELSDFLYAQSLLAQYQAQTGEAPTAPPSYDNAQALPVAQPAPVAQPIVQRNTGLPDPTQSNDLYDEGVREIFGKRDDQPMPPPPQNPQNPQATGGSWHNPLELNPMKIAYSKLPMALRNRKFGRPSFHDHSASDPTDQPQRVPTAAEAWPTSS